MKKLFLCLFLSIMLVSCSNNEYLESEKAISDPVDIVGVPNRIYVVVNSKETVYEKDTFEYDTLLENIRKRFPKTLKESAMAIPWKNDDGTYNWAKMGEEIDFIRLSYDDTLTVKLDCFESSNHLPQKLSFNDLIFPLSEDVVIVGTNKTYGVLEEMKLSV